MVNTNDPAPPLTWKKENTAQQKLRMRVIIISLLVSLALLGLKFLAYRITHSSAVLSDALESIINVVASAFATLSIWMAAKPPDPEHPYGHGKIEYFSAGFEGALIICAAIGIFYAGFEHLRRPRELPHLEKGLLILCATIAVNLLLSIMLMRVGRRTNSISLIADGKHVLTDVLTSGGVLIGLALVHWTGWLRLDGIVACLVGINIIITGGKLLKQSFARLMDASDPDLLDRIAELLQRHRRPEWVDIHQLRAWQAGSLTHIDLHLVLPEDLSMERAHHEAKTLELLLIHHFQGNASVLVHMDPCEDRQCPICGLKSCLHRTSKLGQEDHWNQDHLVRTPANRRKADKSGKS